MEPKGPEWVWRQVTKLQYCLRELMKAARAAGHGELGTAKSCPPRKIPLVDESAMGAEDEADAKGTSETG